MSELTELESWKADAIRLLGEKVKAEKERDALLMSLVDMVRIVEAFSNTMELWDGQVTKLNGAKALIAEIERG